MKKVLITLLLMTAAVLFLEPAQTLLSKFLTLEKPTEYQIREGDWLSKIAKEYYNNPSYWKELALVNRAPKGDRIFPGEKVIVPSFRAIQEIRRARSLSKVNQLIREQQNLMDGATAVLQSPPIESAPASPAKTVKLISPSSEVRSPRWEEEVAEVGRPSKLDYALLSGVAAMVLLFVGGIYFYVRKKNADEVQVYGHKPEPIENIETGRSVYLDGYEDEISNQRSKKNRDVELV